MLGARWLAVLTIPLSLAACGPGGLSKQEGGLGIGALAGGILGNQIGGGKGKIVTTALGAVIGGIVGSEIGRSLDRQDQIAAQRAEFLALERGRSGQATPWRNPGSGRYGEVVPGRPFQRGPQQCRTFVHTVYIDGRPEMMRGTACRNHDGAWRKVA